MASLQTYRALRRFGITEEPKGKLTRKGGHSFVVQKHAATRLHYDLRLELDGVMKSWAVTRGPSLIPGEKRLAVQVEDHPIDYTEFEGIIPEGEYGAGTVMIWDRGSWEPQSNPRKGLEKGHLSFTLYGEKLHGGWHLVRMRQRPNEKRKNWLLIKQHDDAERSHHDQDILEEMPLSAVTGRSLDVIAQGDSKKITKEKSIRKLRHAHVVRSTTETARTKYEDNLIADAPTASLPTFVTPCLAIPAKKAPSSDAWLHEIKFDGYRLQARLSNKNVRLLTRRGLNWTNKFPSIARAIAKLPAEAALIDGEVVVEDSNGISGFSLLQQALKTSDGDGVIFYAFDLMHLDGHNLTSLSLSQRKKALSKLLDRVPKLGTIRLSESIVGSGPALLRKACKMGLEGLVSKREDAPYRSGRGHDWIKTKCADRQEFVVVGFAPSATDSRAIGALVLGFYDKGTIHYAGRTGTGFSFDVARSLYHKLNSLAVKQSPFDPVPREERGTRRPTWVKPSTVVEVNFHGWTRANRVRQASFKGVREDKLASDVVREVTINGPVNNGRKVKKNPRASAPRRAEAHLKNSNTVGHVKLTHPHRIYWPDGKITKQNLADYYTCVWPWMKPHLIGRPIAVVRCPEGMNVSQCFFQKHAKSGISSEYLQLTPENGDKIISVNDLNGLISLVQAGALEIHIRGTTIDHREEADRLVFDLDPGPGVPWKNILAAARDLRARLAAIKLETFIKTSGGKGLHIVVPIEPTPWNEAKTFTRTIAEVLETDHPNSYVASATKIKRHNRIFVDYLRNSRKATAIAPYSTRARPGAPVSVPIRWSELGSLKSADQYTITNVTRRLAQLRPDPWAMIGKIKQSLPRFK